MRSDRSVYRTGDARVFEFTPRGFAHRVRVYYHRDGGVTVVRDVPGGDVRVSFSREDWAEIVRFTGGEL